MEESNAVPEPKLGVNSLLKFGFFELSQSDTGFWRGVRGKSANGLVRYVTLRRWLLNL
jgi:hypothetical protein